MIFKVFCLIHGFPHQIVASPSSLYLKKTKTKHLSWGAKIYKRVQLTGSFLSQTRNNTLKTSLSLEIAEYVMLFQPMPQKVQEHNLCRIRPSNLTNKIRIIGKTKILPSNSIQRHDLQLDLRQKLKHTWRSNQKNICYKKG